ncbi:hypothetical protein A9K97_gp345 [Tokyovirus A1]|uniref:hypothetical protein n=1 Tax=Tokyovirus A1 TaxID=1826170 RepID=UPI0007A9896C|nr:hypothetical protein A9K97_gp345 [Tokyovirus A1]BAU80006.1 hypothetical protein [Tokyovirus A1]
MEELSQTKRKLFSLAIEQAEKSEMSQKIGCVIVMGGRPVSFGYNKDMDGFVLGNHCRMHAEMCALRRLLKGSYAQEVLSEA